MNSRSINAVPRRNLVLYFQVHQPKRLGNIRFFDIGNGTPLYHNEMDREIIQRIANKCYLPANELLLHLINENPDIKVAFSISGIMVEQLEEYAPDVLKSFRDLALTGNVEFLSETYYHSLACMIPGKEFEVQVLKHAEKMYEHFGVRPSVFRNTELIYSDDIGKRISRLGYTGVITDGVERVLGQRSPNHVYQHSEQEQLKILLRNYRLSDDIGFRFIENGKTLSAAKYVSWLENAPAQEEVITLAMDYETFGEHRKKETGIFTFLEEALTRIAESDVLQFATPSKVIANVKAHDILTVPYFISWADQERDLSAWLGNEMQRDAFDNITRLEFDVKNIGDPELLNIWRGLQTSDHLYYMSTKKGSDGMVHNYFSPYNSPYEAFINFMNVLTDFSMRIKILKSGKIMEGKTVRSTYEEANQAMGSRMTMLSTH
jgi:alpha-amylase